MSTTFLLSSKKIICKLKLDKRLQGARHVSVVTEYPVHALSTTTIKERFKKYQIPFIDGHTCFRLAECKMCLPAKKSSTAGTSEIYVNKQTGFFVCELCKCAGHWNILERLMMKQKTDGERTAKDVISIKEACFNYFDKGQQNWKKATESCIPLHALSDEQYSKVFLDFGFRECSRQAIEKLNIYVSHDAKNMFLPLMSSTQLVLGFIKVDLDQKTTVTPKQNCAGFLVHAAKKKQGSAVVVSNLQDFFALVSVQISSVHIICLPYGASNLPQISLPFLENYESLTLWLGSVPCAWDATRSFAKKLNEKRCLVIRTLEQQLTPAESVANHLDIPKLLSQALPTWHQAITTFAALRSDILQELINYEEVLGVRWKRFPSLNKILRGHRRGELTVLTGPTGSGKTTFMSEYSLDLASQGVNTLWGSFEVRNVRLARTMLQQFVGSPLETSLDKYNTWADDFEKLPIYFLAFHGQQSVRDVMEAVQHAAYIHDIGHVVIDNVQFMIGMAEENRYNDRFYKQDLIIHAFRTFATRANCHVTLVIHPRKERETDELTTTSIFGGAKAAQEADNVLIIQDKRLSSTSGKKFLQVSKNRYTGDLGIMLLNFNKDGLTYRHMKKKTTEELTVKENTLHENKTHLRRVS